MACFDSYLEVVHVVGVDRSKLTCSSSQERDCRYVLKDFMYFLEIVGDSGHGRQSWARVQNVE